MDWEFYLALALAVAPLLSTSVRRVVVETFRHPTRQTLMVRDEESGELHVVDDPRQREHA